MFTVYLHTKFHMPSSRAFVTTNKSTSCVAANLLLHIQTQNSAYCSQIHHHIISTNCNKPTLPPHKFHHLPSCHYQMQEIKKYVLSVASNKLRFILIFRQIAHLVQTSKEMGKHTGSTVIRQVVCRSDTPQISLNRTRNKIPLQFYLRGLPAFNPYHANVEKMVSS